MSERLRPIVKWAGGKRSLVPRILEELPERIGTYYEPFVGGAAVFLALAGERRFERAVITDKNEELINLYTVVQRDVDKLLRKLQQLQGKLSEADYYEIRERKPRSNVDRAARLIYLNKTGYNGLYRVNSSGGFNVPYGRYKKPTIYDPERLRAAAVALRDVTIEVADFEDACSEARKGDAVYFDPPYLPVSKTASFSAYHSDAFGLAEHERLAKLFDRLVKLGVCAVLSNSATPETRRLYKRFNASDVQVRRPINSVASRRGAIAELLVVSK